MKIIDFFQPPHITSLILAFVFTSSEALAAATQSRSCNQYFFVGNTPGSAEVTTCPTSAGSTVAQWITNLGPLLSSSNVTCLTNKEGNVIPGHQLETLIALQYHVEDEGRFRIRTMHVGTDVPKRISTTIQPVSHSQLGIKSLTSRADTLFQIYQPVPRVLSKHDLVSGE
ncbi:hypothetical protein PSTT_05590, partial [Puccinia striiformis]